MNIQYRQSEIDIPENCDIKRGREQYRITLYFENKNQKDKVVNTLHNIQYKNNFKKIGDAAEFVVDSMNGDLR